MTAPLHRHRPGWLASAGAATFLCLAVPTTRAAVLTVNSAADTTGTPGVCTLRDAMTAANTNVPVGGCAAGSPYPDTDTINIPQSAAACAGGGCEISLATALPFIVEPVSIAGTGDWTPVINGNTGARHFDIGGVAVTLTNLRLINGLVRSTTANGWGGSIRTSNLGSTVVIERVSFVNNSSLGRGGAIYVNSGGTTVTINNSSFSGNTAFGNTPIIGSGGAIAQGGGGTLIVTNSTFSGNSANQGGALYTANDSETRLTNVTLSGNRATRDGGAILHTSTLRALTGNNVTLTANVADSDADGTGDGGGIARSNGPLSLQNSIVAGNLDNTPLAATPNTRHPDCSWLNGGALTSNGYNLLGIDAGCAGLTEGLNGDRVGTAAAPLDARFAPLADNGGPTLTHSIYDDSPALNAGSPAVPGGGAFGACAARDQRDIYRPLQERCDMGAVEVETGDTDRDGIDDTNDNCITAANGTALPDAGGNSQLDTDGDDFGNLCDGDLDNSSQVNATDLARFRTAFATPANPNFPHADFNGNGAVNAADLAIFRGLFGKPPGPSGLNCVPGTPGCNWARGQMHTASQPAWGDANSPAGLLLAGSFASRYGAGGLVVGYETTMTFTTASAVFAYLPALGPINTLFLDQVNPVVSSTGELGGEVVALKLNVDLSAELGNVMPLGAVRICNFGAIPVLNGQTIDQFLTTANFVLSGGNASLTPAGVHFVARLLNTSFVNGYVSDFAQVVLFPGACP